VNRLVRTVLGDVDPSTLGVVLAHEHLIIDSPVVAAKWPQIHLSSVEEAIAETREIAAVGVGTMVDAMPLNAGGDPGRLAELSRVTGLNIVASTGMHTAKYYEDESLLRADAQQLASWFMLDVIEGHHGVKAGVVKVATAGQSPSHQEQRLFEAAAVTQESTGVPILTHCEDGRGGLAQIDLLHGLGVSLDRVAMSHVDKVTDVVYHRDLAESGVYLCYDQGLRTPEQTAGLVGEMIALGYGSRLLIGTDGARRTLWSTLGGSPGLAWIQSGFRELLVGQGLGRPQLDQLFVANPAAWLAFGPES